MPQSKTVEFQAKCIKDTEKALLCEIDGHEEQVWIPRSQIDDASEVKDEDDEGKLVVTEWIATEKGLV